MDRQARNRCELLLRKTRRIAEGLEVRSERSRSEGFRPASSYRRRTNVVRGVGWEPRLLAGMLSVTPPSATITIDG
jgi:hypothetical protein